MSRQVSLSEVKYLFLAIGHYTDLKSRALQIYDRTYNTQIQATIHFQRQSHIFSCLSAVLIVQYAIIAFCLYFAK
jgi:hypothetical protein